MTDKEQDQGQEMNFDQRSGVEALVARLGGLRPCAAQLGLAVGTVQGWKKRGSIPAAHQQKIRELLHTLAQEKVQEKAQEKTQEKTEEQKKDTDEAEGEDISMPTMQEKAQENKEKEEKQEEEKQEKAASFSSLKASEEATTEEGIVSAFTSGDDFEKGDEGGLDISSEVWEHAALPRSTSGQWAILISLIALVGLLTRPLWAGPIDTKLMGTFADGGHGASQSSEPQDSHASDGASDTETSDSEASAQSSSDKQDGTQADATSSTLDALPRDLLARLQGLERDMAGVSAQQSAPAAAELRRLKSESDALSAAFDNQSARLDSLVELLQRRTEALSRLRSQVERLEQNRATERLSRRLNALFQLENIAYAITQRRVFSIEALESSLSRQERQQMEDALALLTQANNLSSPQRLLADYRRLLPELLVWQAMGKAEQGDSERGFVARFAQKLRAQMFGVFSLRRRYGDSLDVSSGDSSGDAEASLLAVERMLEDGRFQQAEERLAQASPSSAQAREQLGEEVAAKLQAFRSALSARNNVFAALHEIRDALSSRETGDPKTRQPSS